LNKRNFRSFYLKCKKSYFRLLFTNQNLIKYLEPGDKQTTSVIKKRFKQSKDYNIVVEMMKDLNSVDQFRTIQKNEFLTRNPFEDNDIMTGEVDHFKTEEERNLIRQKFFTIHQKAYIKNCKENRALPLPLLKKIKFDVFVLKNYQISHAVAESFGASMHHLSEYLKGIILSNNNMRDNEILLILQGMRFNPIRSLVIENNKLGPLSMKEL